MRTREPDVPVVRWVPFEIYGVGGGMVINLQCSVFKVNNQYGDLINCQKIKKQCDDFV
jgi:hypothetical protein